MSVNTINSDYNTSKSNIKKKLTSDNDSSNLMKTMIFGAKNQECKLIDVPHPKRVSCLTFVDDETLAAGFPNGEIVIYSMTRAEDQMQLQVKRRIDLQTYMPGAIRSMTVHKHLLVVAIPASGLMVLQLPELDILRRLSKWEIHSNLMYPGGLSIDPVNKWVIVTDWLARKDQPSLHALSLSTWSAVHHFGETLEWVHSTTTSSNTEDTNITNLYVTHGHGIALYHITGNTFRRKTDVDLQLNANSPSREIVVLLGSLLVHRVENHSDKFYKLNDNEIAQKLANLPERHGRPLCLCTDGKTQIVFKDALINRCYLYHTQ